MLALQRGRSFDSMFSLEYLCTWDCITELEYVGGWLVYICLQNCCRNLCVIPLMNLKGVLSPTETQDEEHLHSLRRHPLE